MDGILGNTIIAAIVSAIVAHILNVCSKRKQNKIKTSWVLSYINNEICDNYENKIKTENSYTILSVRGFDLIDMHAGDLKITEPQKKEIIDLYGMFVDINNKINTIQSLKANRQYTPGSNLMYVNTIFETMGDSKDLKDLQESCLLMTEKYIKEYC